MSSFIYCIFIITILSFLVELDAYFCKGNICDLNCANCSYVCDPSTCLPSKNCQCASKSIPGGLSLDQTPQFILFTLDDVFPGYLMSIVNNLDFILKDPLIKDRNNCSIRSSIYANHLENDYYWLKYFESNGGSIGLHTLTHNTHWDTVDPNIWKDELETNFKSIRELGRIENIYGARAPFLQMNDVYINQIYNMGLKYDSSMAQYKDNNNKFYWPFTLDNGVPDRAMCWTMGDCIIKPYPGLWEFPLTYWMNQKGEPYDLMSEILTNSSLEDFKADFNLTYNSNRAPRGFFNHPQYYTTNLDFIHFDEVKANILRDIYRYIATKPNVLFATEAMIIEWMKNPLPFEQTKKLSVFQCPTPFYQTPSEVCNMTTCQFSPTSRIKICGLGKACPIKQPELGGALWSNFPGNTNNYNLNYYHYVENNLTKWLGTAKITLNQNWGDGLCADFSVKNPKNNTAYSQIIIFKICKQIDKDTDVLWGGDPKRLNYNPVKWIKVDKREGIIYPAFSEVPTGGFCLGYTTPFTFNTAFRISVEFYDYTVSCNSSNCSTKCGDNICDTDKGENQTNCAVDCLPC